MNFKKFISGVSAFAIAASAFAAMAVTASATDYSESVAITTSDAYNVASYNSAGLATAKSLASGAYAGIRKDLSGLTDIENASTVTVEFDTAMNSGSVIVFGFGDASQATAMASGNGNYKPDGRAIYFGSVDGSGYKAYDVKSNQSVNIGTTAFGKVVHARITLDRDAGTYSYYIGYSSTAKIEGSGMATDIDNLTYVDAYTKTSGAQFQFKNIKVSYTVADAPAVPVVSSEVVAAQAFTTPDYDEDMVVGVINLSVSEAAIDLADATYQGQTGTVTGETSFMGEALINVIITGATSTDALNDVVFN